MPYLMGIDLGSTSLKAVIFDLDGNLVASGSSPTLLSHPDKNHPQWAVWQPEDIWNGVIAAIRSVLAKVNDSNEVKAVAVTGFGYDGIPIGKDGEWLYPFISWHCHRTQPQRDAWVEKLGTDKFFNLTGRLALPYNTVFRILWLRDHHPEILDNTYKWLMIEDFINYMLCGAVATDYSMASCTLAMDLKEGNWSDELLTPMGIDKNIFPEIHQSGTYLGNISARASRQTGLSTGTAVVLGGHDYHCAGIPAGLLDESVLINVAGTWEMLLSARKNAILDHRLMESGIVLESHVIKDLYTLMGAEVSGGMLEWFKTVFGGQEMLAAQQNGDNVWSLLMGNAEASPCGSNGVYFLPHFAGRSCVKPDSSSLGAFVGLNGSVGKGDLARAVVEGLNYQFYEMLLCMEDLLGRRYDRIRSVGGVTRNTLLMQNKADITGRVIEALEMEEATSLGAALLAGIGAGFYKDAQEAFHRTFKRGKLFYPEQSRTVRYQKYFSLYKELHPSLKLIHTGIFREFKA